MTPLEFRDWLQLVQALGTAALGAWFFIEKRNDNTNERVTDLGERMETIDKELARIAVSYKAAPTHNDLANVYHAQNRTEEKLNQLIGETRSQSDMLRLMWGRITEKGMP